MELHRAIAITRPLLRWEGVSTLSEGCSGAATYREQAVGWVPTAAARDTVTAEAVGELLHAAQRLEHARARCEQLTAWADELYGLTEAIVGQLLPTVKLSLTLEQIRTLHTITEDDDDAR